MKRRKKIRIRSFLGALILGLGIWGTAGNIKAMGYEREINISNQNSLFQLCEYMDSIETDLMKSTYAVSGEMLGTITDRLQRDTAGAKESLSFLSPGKTPLSGTYKFLSQVGDFTAYLSRKAGRGEKITGEERTALQELSALAAGLSLKFQYMGDLLAGDYFSFREISDAVVNSSPDSESTVSYLDTISDAEEAFGNYPTLIYDGPFSDSVLNRESVFLEGREEITKERAREIAAEILGTEEKMLVEESDTEGRLAAYCFRTEIYSIAVTKRGGYPLRIMSVITAGEEKHSKADAAERAKNFLRLQGFPDMVTTYSASNDGICTVSFAYKQGSFICYPDLIKVSVSLSDGRITAFDASDYLMNHREREIPPFGITPEEAMKDIIGTVTKVSAAVIPGKDGTERYTYELLCEGADGQHILVYKDIRTGEEADILILLYSDNGTLTK